MSGGDVEKHNKTKKINKDERCDSQHKDIQHKDTSYEMLSVTI